MSSLVSRYLPGVAALVVAMLLCAAPVLAQDSDDEPLEEEVSNTEGLMVSGSVGALGITSAAQDDSDGGGTFGIQVGYGFSRLFTLYAGLDLGGMEGENSFTQAALQSDEYGAATFQLGGQFHFRTYEKLVPFFDVALTGIGMGSDTSGEDRLLSGGGLSVGGGVKYFVSPVFALNGGLYFGSGTWDELEVGDETTDVGAGYDSGRLRVGVSWFPFQ
jgi:hypothetical protein